MRVLRDLDAGDDAAVLERDLVRLVSFLDLLRRFEDRLDQLVDRQRLINAGQGRPDVAADRFKVMTSLAFGAIFAQVNIESLPRISSRGDPTFDLVGFERGRPLECVGLDFFANRAVFVGVVSPQGREDRRQVGTIELAIQKGAAENERPLRGLAQDLKRDGAELSLIAADRFQGQGLGADAVAVGERARRRRGRRDRRRMSCTRFQSPRSPRRRPEPVPARSPIAPCSIGSILSSARSAFRPHPWAARLAESVATKRTESSLSSSNFKTRFPAGLPAKRQTSSVALNRRIEFGMLGDIVGQTFGGHRDIQRNMLVHFH